MEPTPLPFTTDTGAGARARLGMVVLETDRTLEHEARSLPLEGVAWFHARIPQDPHVTPDHLTDMLAHLPATAALLPAAFGFDAVGYGCTSAATLIGEDAVDEALRSAHPEAPTTNPITAAVAAFRALGARRLAVVTPYTSEVTAPIVDLLGAHGFEVAAVGSFLEPSDLVVSRITESSVADGVRTVVGQAPDIDAVFVSCTSLRLFGVVEALEAELDRPVVSSNLAFCWHLLRLAGIDDRLDGFGRLFRST